MNFALDFFLVFGPPQMGVAGAAIATTVSQYVSLGVLLWMLVSSGRLIPADLFELPPREEIALFVKARWGFRVWLLGFFRVLLLGGLGFYSLGVSELESLGVSGFVA